MPIVTANFYAGATLNRWAKWLSDFMAASLKTGMKQGLGYHASEDATQDAIVRFLRKARNGAPIEDTHVPLLAQLGAVKFEAKAQHAAYYLGKRETDPDKGPDEQPVDTRPKLVISTPAADLFGEATHVQPRTAYDEDEPNPIRDLLERSPMWRSLSPKVQTIALVVAMNTKRRSPRKEDKNTDKKKKAKGTDENRFELLGRVDWQSVSKDVSSILGEAMSVAACKKAWARVKPVLRHELVRMIRRHPRLAHLLTDDEKRPQELDTPEAS